MIKLAFKITSFFWIVSPCAFIVGRSLGYWNTKNDWLLFLGLMAGSAIFSFLNYNPEE